MDCLYINLDSATARRVELEENFTRYMSPHGFRLHRFPARTIEDVRRFNLTGSQTDGAKACYLSHTAAIKTSLDFSGPVMILEDDARFGERTAEKIIEALHKILKSGVEWDMFFTDVIISDLPQMANLFWDMKINQRREKQNFKIFDLKGWTFCGMSAYVVNFNSKKKLVEIFKGQGDIDKLNDIYVRDKIADDHIKALTICPHLTAVSEHAENSQVQADESVIANRAINAFRQLCWNDIDISSLDEKKLIADLDKDFFGQEANYFAQIVRIISAKKFKLI